MWKPGSSTSAEHPSSERSATPGLSRDRAAQLLAIATAVSVVAAFVLTQGLQFLMPGPLASAHGAIEKCATCHTKSGSGKWQWVHGLVSGDPLADSKACLTCHKMPKTAFNSHGAAFEVLLESTKRLRKVAAQSPAPLFARAQDKMFPMHDVVSRGLYCATCHQEHQGINFNLNKISNDQCRSCHVAKFNSFDSDHPKFENYPFKKRTHIIYDHAGHFGKHYPELAKKDPTKQIPTACATCHNSRNDRRIMAVEPFDKTCSGCHLDQIVGKERASGPKGIAYLSLPGLDVQTLRKRKAPIGEWPESSEASLTPFMKVMISRSKEGKALLKAVNGLDLQDLSSASDAQIEAVAKLAQEIKQLFYKLISGKASDVLGDLNIGGGAKLSTALVADLTASIPRDVVIRAQQQWLPNLAREMAGGQAALVEDPGAAPAPQALQSDRAADPEPQSSEPDAGEADSSAPEDASASDDTTEEPTDTETANSVKRDPPTCMVRVLGQCLMFKTEDGQPAEAKKNQPPPSVGALPGAMPAGLTELARKGQDDQSEKAATPGTPSIRIAEATTAAPPGNAPGQSDDLLSPTPAETREIEAQTKGAAKGRNTSDEGPASNGNAGGGASAGSTNQAGEIAKVQAPAVISIESDVDPESWAEYGGWYQQDNAIFYRPTGHKDRFIYTWLFLTGPQSRSGDESPAAAVFAYLTGKDAQGACTKCHSIDDTQNKAKVVNFSPKKIEAKQGSFTRFVHEPHFGMVEKRGCMTCHNLEKGRPYLKSYEQGDPKKFASSFSQVEKSQCQACHTSGEARQDCLLCHKYHVNGVTTPITSTKLPIQ